MFTWKCAVDEMYVTSLPANYPVKNNQYRAPYIRLWKCIHDAICVLRMFSCQITLSSQKMKITVDVLVIRLFMPITTFPHRSMSCPHDINVSKSECSGNRTRNKSLQDITKVSVFIS